MSMAGSISGVFSNESWELDTRNHEMKLALLGCDDEALELLRNMLSGDQHRLVAVYDAGRYVVQLHHLAPLARFDDAWESLLVGNEAEAVLVARGRFDPFGATGFSGEERRVDQLRKLVQAAVPLLVVQPACEMIVGYELEMIREDSGGIMLPYVPGLFHPAIEDLQELARDESLPLGEIEQVIFERQLSERNREEVLRHFSRDVAIVRRLLGTIRQLSATGPAGSEYHDPLARRSKELPALGSLSVHLSGERPYSSRWSVGPVDDFAGARIVLVGSRGRVTLRMPDDSQRPWEIATPDERQSEYPPFNAPLDALERLQAVRKSPGGMGNQWLNACRDLEAAAAIDRSLEKGRAIALYTDGVSEEQSFKGVMAVGGCLILTVTLLGVFFVVLVEALQLELRRAPLWKLWPAFLLAPIVLFLLLQMLQLVARKGVRQEKRALAAGEESAATVAD